MAPGIGQMPFMWKIIFDGIWGDITVIDSQALPALPIHHDKT
jgi:hypothetical protein